jgi:uncharacterized protein YndB with AHSA1/START domain
VRPFTLEITIDAPRERVFDYLADVANHVEFSDHYLRDFRLERLESRGLGASARFRVAFGRSLWGEIVIRQLERPHRIVLGGQAGRIGRIPLEALYTLTPYGHDMTRVEYRFSTAPANKVDELREALGGRLWLRRQSQRALRRLAGVLESGSSSAHAVRVAAG